jgi:hypothetical protein
MINDGNAEFTDEAEEFGVRKGGWGWAATFTDFDNDQDADLFHTTQNVLRLNRSDPHYTYPMLYERSGTSFTNLDASDHGLTEGDGRGIVAIDYDNDGDQELITNNYEANVTVYDNVGQTGNSLQFRVTGADGDSTAFGARVRVSATGESTVVPQTDGSDFLSQDPLVSHVGLGDAETADVHVTWPDGTEATFEDVAANQRIVISPDVVDTVATFDDG